MSLHTHNISDIDLIILLLDLDMSTTKEVFHELRKRKKISLKKNFVEHR